MIGPSIISSARSSIPGSSSDSPGSPSAAKSGLVLVDGLTIEHRPQIMASWGSAGQKGPW